MKRLRRLAQREVLLSLKPLPFKQVCICNLL